MLNPETLPLSKIFWTIFALESAVVASMVTMGVISIVNRKGGDGGAVGAWLAVIPLTGLALVAGCFLLAKAPWARIACIAFLLLPVGGPIVARPLAMIRDYVHARRAAQAVEGERRGVHDRP